MMNTRAGAKQGRRPAARHGCAWQILELLPCSVVATLPLPQASPPAALPLPLKPRPSDLRGRDRPRAAVGVGAGRVWAARGPPLPGRVPRAAVFEVRHPRAGLVTILSVHCRKACAAAPGAPLVRPRHVPCAVRAAAAPPAAGPPATGPRSHQCSAGVCWPAAMAVGAAALAAGPLVSCQPQDWFAPSQSAAHATRRGSAGPPRAPRPAMRASPRAGVTALLVL